MGISFYKPHGTKRSTSQTSLVQAFNESGDGLVLRGPDFTWNPKRPESKSPHLTQDYAERLLLDVIARYQRELGQAPRRLVLHKSSSYWPEEREGFRRALEGQVQQFDFLSLDTRQNTVRLLPASTYPPLRGTWFSIEDIDLLYTDGFLADLGQYHGLHVPSPIQITDHVGQDTARGDLLREVLILTKMNWNSARLGGKIPITLKFSNLVGEIMRGIPDDREPLPQFKFYM